MNAPASAVRGAARHPVLAFHQPIPEMKAQMMSGEKRSLDPDPLSAWLESTRPVRQGRNRASKCACPLSALAVSAARRSGRTRSDVLDAQFAPPTADPTAAL